MNVKIEFATLVLLFSFVSNGLCDGPAPSPNERAQEKEEHLWRKKHAKEIRYDDSQFLSQADEVGETYRYDKNGNPIHQNQKAKHAKKKHLMKKKISKSAAKGKTSSEVKETKAPAPGASPFPAHESAGSPPAQPPQSPSARPASSESPAEAQPPQASESDSGSDSE